MFIMEAHDSCQVVEKMHIISRCLPVHLRTRLKEAPSSFCATRDVILSASHIAVTTLRWLRVLSQGVLSPRSESQGVLSPRSECSYRRSLVRGPWAFAHDAVSNSLPRTARISTIEIISTIIKNMRWCVMNVTHTWQTLLQKEKKAPVIR